MTHFSGITRISCRSEKNYHLPAYPTLKFLLDRPMPRILSCFGCATPTEAHEPPAVNGAPGPNGNQGARMQGRDRFPAALRGQPGRAAAQTARVTDLFAAKSASEKIDWLLDQLQPLTQYDASGRDRIIAGNRSLSRKEAFCYALELSLESRRDSVPEVSRRLLDEFPESTPSFLLFGIPFARGRLTEWVRGNLPQVQSNHARPEMVRLNQTLYASSGQHGNPQNVHASNVLIALAGQFQEIRRRSGSNATRTLTKTDTELRAYLNKPGNRHALQGFETVRKRNDVMANFDDSVHGALRTLWNYIGCCSDELLKEQLRQSMVAKLSEIARESPCAVGMIERIIDIPTAIDWSLTQQISVDQLRQELQTIAGTINLELETELGDYADLVRSEAGLSHITGDPESVFSEIKRARFLQTAEVELCMLRGIDRTSVLAEANRIFPEGTVL